MLKHLVIALTLLQTVAWSAPIYIVGSITEGLNSTPTLWIAQTTSLQSPPQNIPLGSSSATASANAVVSVGNTIYCVGGQGILNSATLWIIDVPSTQTKNPSIITKSLSSNESEALGIIPVGAQLFIVGYEKQSGSLKATLWITDTSGTSPQTITLSADESKGNSIAFYNGQVYIVGYTKDGSSTKPCLWITNVNGSTPQQIALDTTDNGEASSILVIKNQLYCLGYNAKQNQAQVWITDLLGAHTKNYVLGPKNGFGYCFIKNGTGILNLVASSDPNLIPRIIPTSTSGMSFGEAPLYTPQSADSYIVGTSSMAQLTNNVYAVGYASLLDPSNLPGTNNATLWKINLSIATPYTIEKKNSIAVGIFIPQGSQLLPAAVKKQTTKYQIGI